MSIARLNPRHGAEVWVNQALAGEVEESVAETLGTVPAELRWFYWSYPAGREARLVWVGRTGVTGFIRRAFRRSSRGAAPALYATRLTCRSAVVRREAEEMAGAESGADPTYWLGDVTEGNWLCCGDDLFVTLWNRLRDGAATAARTSPEH